MVSDLPDKERILVHIIQELASTLLLAQGAMALKFNNRSLASESKEREYVHFGYSYSVKPQPGDLVLCNTSGIHPYTIGWWVRSLPYGGTVREIGSDRICNVGNESFYVIKGLEVAESPVMWEGKRYEFYRRLMRQWGKMEHGYIYRYAGIEFSEDGKTASVGVRQMFEGNVLLRVELRADPLPSMKTIRTTINAAIDAYDKARKPAAVNEAWREAGDGSGLESQSAAMET